MARSFLAQAFDVHRTDSSDDVDGDIGQPVPPPAAPVARRRQPTVWGRLVLFILVTCSLGFWSAQFSKQRDLPDSGLDSIEDHVLGVVEAFWGSPNCGSPNKGFRNGGPRDGVSRYSGFVMDIVSCYVCCRATGLII